MELRFTQEIKYKLAFFHLLFFKKEKENPNTITFIVVYIFNTGRFEIVSFNAESQFLNVSLSFYCSRVFKDVAVGLFQKL